ncbi:hypothetical protein DL96DRAFT_616232 [Flagelloscypha sp. PMI_526]|nr:hypothetical protein DL96DRAFT_616232 [Flagelloscypha sp. PMI_526]
MQRNMQASAPQQIFNLTATRTKGITGCPGYRRDEIRLSLSKLSHAIIIHDEPFENEVCPSCGNVHTNSEAMLAYPSSPHFSIEDSSDSPAQPPFFFPSHLPTLTRSNYEYSYSRASHYAPSPPSGQWADYNGPNVPADPSHASSTSSDLQLRWNHEQCSTHTSPWLNAQMVPRAFSWISPESYASYSLTTRQSPDILSDEDGTEKAALPSKKRMSPTARISGIHHTHSPSSGEAVFTPGMSPSAPSSAKTRHSVRPPGLTRCTSCRATNSPEWRKGPTGKKELCNSCGLRYARSKAKKEGNAAPRKKKEKLAHPSKAQVVDRGDTGSPASTHVAQDYVPLVSPTPPPSLPPQQQYHVHSTITINGGYSIMYSGSQLQYPPPSPQQQPASYYSAAAGLASLSNEQYSFSRATQQHYAGDHYGRATPPQHLMYDRESREREQEQHRARDREARTWHSTVNSILWWPITLFERILHDE